MILAILPRIWIAQAIPADGNEVAALEVLVSLLLHLNRGLAHQHEAALLNGDAKHLPRRQWTGVWRYKPPPIGQAQANVIRIGLAKERGANPLVGDALRR